MSQFSRHTKINAQDIEGVLAQVNDALLEADVPHQLAQEFIALVKQEVVGQEIVSKLKPAEQFMKVLHDTLLKFFGGAQANELQVKGRTIIMVMGLQGSGKTTTIAKLAHHLLKEAKKKGQDLKIVTGSIDFYRPAAIDQLALLASQVGISFYRTQATHPVTAVRELYTHYMQHHYDLLLVDTAGRLHVAQDMLQELREVMAELNPTHKVLVLDAMTGQESLPVARAFEQAVGFNAAILTKMDSDTRGGAAFSFRYALKKPIAYVGTGEKMEDLALFYPERAVSRILGMGDMQTLIDRAQEKIKQSDHAATEKSFMAGELTLADFAKQMDMIGQLGSLSTIMKLMPGMGSSSLAPQELERGEADLKRFRAIMNSMTPKERVRPQILDGSRKKRIAQGAGVSVADINTLLQRFQQAQQYVKLLRKSGPFKRLFQ
jgi:signal recognition particle subunit SRP54